MTAIIVEDEKKHQEKLIKLLREGHPEIDILGIATTLKEARDLLSTHQPEVLFLDIELGPENGFDLIKSGLPPLIKPVIVSSYSKYGVEACNLSATAFILKEDLEEQLAWSIDKVQTSLSEEAQRKRNEILIEAAIRLPQGLGPERLVISKTNRDYYVAISTIIYLEANGNKVKFYLEDSREVPQPSCGLKFYADPLLRIKPKFQKPHNAFVVNMTKVEALEKGSSPKLIMQNGAVVPVAKSKIGRIRVALQEYGVG